MSKVKQVIVINKALKMRRGKEVAQGAHSSLMFLTDRLNYSNRSSGSGQSWVEVSCLLSKEEEEWIKGNFAKVCVQVNSEKELHEIYRAAKTAGLTVHLITDAGLTEFGGVPTKTCLCIGPHDSEKIDKITGHLPLY